MRAVAVTLALGECIGVLYPVRNGFWRTLLSLPETQNKNYARKQCARPLDVLAARNIETVCVHTGYSTLGMIMFRYQHQHHR